MTYLTGQDHEVVIVRTCAWGLGGRGGGVIRTSLAAGRGGCGRAPGAGRVDGLAVAVQPGAQFVQRSLLEVGDAAGAVGADVDQQVAAVGDDIGQQTDQLGAGEGVGDGLLGVVPEGAAKAATELPG